MWDAGGQMYTLAAGKASALPYVTIALLSHPQHFFKCVQLQLH